jgi:RNA polymerase sigma-70 factor (ECF subfamily)
LTVVVDDDAELVDRLRAGDEAAFTVLVRRYQARLLRVARSVVGSAAVAEEAVQDTWLGVVRGIDRFEGQSSLKTWLLRILVNRARSAGARERRTEVPVADAETAVPADRFDARGAWSMPPESWADAVDDRLLAADLARRIHTYLEELPAGQREVVILRDVEGLSGADVCAALGINDGHQRVLLHRGRAKVRAMLEAELGKA